jgi:phage terminase large subunit
LVEFKASETKIIPESELEAAKSEMGEDKYNQEFECSFSASVEGSYYGQSLNGLESEGRFHKIERDDLCKTFVAWDLGMGDSTSIWVAQVANHEVRLMDYIENHGQGLDWYVRELTNRGWHKAPQLLPHDVQVRELGTGKSRLEVLQEAGLDCTVVGRLGVDDGIQAVRRLLPRCYFNVPQVKQGLDCLRNYRREFDEKRQVFFDKPLHDWSSHGSDAFRYLAVGMDERGSGWSKPLLVNTKWVV